jgi:hypothetical protein
MHQAAEVEGLTTAITTTSSSLPGTIITLLLQVGPGPTLVLGIEIPKEGRLLKVVEE